MKTSETAWKNYEWAVAIDNVSLHYILKMLYYWILRC